MNINHLKKPVLILLAVLAINTQEGKAQLETDFFKSGINDGMKLMEAYISPFANAFGAGFNSAWYNTAKPHKFGGFDVTLSVSAGFVPDDALEFDLADIEFSNLQLVNPAAGSIAPTIAGETESGPALHALQPVPGYPGTEVEVVNFNSPQGTGFGVVPAPMLQAGIGLPLGSEIKLRYIPNTPVDEGSLQLFGGGLMKSITEHIKAFNLLPVNISAFAGYNKLSGTIPISVQPESDMYYTNYTLADFNDQVFNVDVTSWNVSLIGSVDIPMVSGYAGIGYSKTATVLAVDGYIPLPTVDPAISTTSPVYKDEGVVEDVEEINIENYSGLRLNVGARLKLAVFTIHADYTYADYNVFTAGIGISFR
ncbi:MAG: hypothetical protein K9J25_03575 [Bacteroidales bacterium]|nr:hypothetical protein [Bacteroidales bacterium]